MKKKNNNQKSKRNKAKNKNENKTKKQTKKKLPKTISKTKKRWEKSARVNEKRKSIKMEFLFWNIISENPEFTKENYVEEFGNINTILASKYNHDHSIQVYIHNYILT